MYRWAFIVLISLAACSSEETNQPSDATFGEGVVHDVFDAARSPLVDLGLKRGWIPEKLQGIALNPYQVPPDATCSRLAYEIAELDVFLGPDIDSMPIAVEGEEKYIQESGELARGAATGFVTSKVSILPFKSVVRKMSGADAHAKEMAYAYQAGRLRRAFLKGRASAYCI